MRDPCGMTRLMVAAVKGGGLDTGEEDEEDGTAAVIADLVAQGAELNATMDKTGETSLHLAARYELVVAKFLISFFFPRNNDNLKMYFLINLKINF